MIIVFTGSGKGKTTASIGQAIRALGHRYKVLILQFIKSPKFETGEEKVLKKLKGITFGKLGSGYVKILNDKYPLSQHKNSALLAWQKCRKFITAGHYDLVILDEINVALKLKLLPIKEVEKFLKKRKNVKPDIILSGRGAPKEIIALADLVTEFKKIKHPFDNGIKARKGIEY